MKEMLNKESIEKIVLGVIVAVIVMIVLIYFIFRPSIGKIRTYSSQLAEQKEKVLIAEQEALRLARLKMNLKKIASQIQIYEAEMPQSSPDWLLGTLNLLATETGLSFEKIEPQGCLMHWGAYDLQAVELQLFSGYHKLGKFINQLEQSSEFLWVLDFDIVGDKQDVSRTKVKLIIGAFVVAPETQEEINEK